MKRQICEHGEYERPRCRKTAITAVIYKYLWAHRMDMKLGNVPVYGQRVTFRCACHEGLDIPGETISLMGISDFHTAVANAEKARAAES